MRTPPPNWPDALYDALDALVRAWRSIPDNCQVPDEINNDDLWLAAEAALRGYQLRSVPDIFDSMETPRA